MSPMIDPFLKVCSCRLLGADCSPPVRISKAEPGRRDYCAEAHHGYYHASWTIAQGCTDRVDDHQQIGIRLLVTTLAGLV